MSPASSQHVSAKTSSSLAFRAQLSKLVSPLRVIRPRVPFYKLPAHTIPTLWYLYRGLLRYAPTSNISFRMKTIFKRNKFLTSPAKTAEQLRRGYKWLDLFRRASDGEARPREILARYDRLIQIRRDKEYWRHLFYVEQVRDAYFSRTTLSITSDHCILYTYRNGFKNSVIDLS
jgi:hypothetical protein